jgi:hypothetical protein
MIKPSYKPVIMLVSVLGGILAAVDRGAAEGTRKLTGVWPGDEGQHAGEA